MSRKNILTAALLTMIILACPAGAHAADILKQIQLIMNPGATAPPSASAPEISDTRGITSTEIYPEKPGVVLVLSGGGTKGIAHIGVIKVLEELDVPIAAIVGTSMGSIIGGLYACGYDSDELYKIITDSNFINLMSDRYSKGRLGAGDDQPPGSPSTLFRIDKDKSGNIVGPLGGMSAIGLYNFLGELVNRRYTGPTFDDLPIPFAAIATDLERGEPVVLRKGNLTGAMRASMAYPGLFDPWYLDGRMLVDGGLLANLPVSIAKATFPGHPIIAVNVSPVRPFVSRSDIHTLGDVLGRTLSIITDRGVEEEEKQADLLIIPDTIGLGLLDAAGYDRISDLGETATRAMSADITALAESIKKAHGNWRSPSFKNGPASIVTSLNIDGVSEAVRSEIYNTYSKWIGKPIDLEALDKAVQKLSRHENFSAVDGHVREDESGEGVMVVLSIQRQPDQVYGLDGYTTNLHHQRWLQISAVKRDLISDGDVGEALLRFGSNWGVQLRYFTPYKGDSQWGFSFTAREESYTPLNWGANDWRRYGFRAAWYNDNGKTRWGIGAIVEHLDLQGDRNKDSWGPYFHFDHNALDNPLYPSKGYSLNVDAWLPSEENPLSKIVLQAYQPLTKDLKLVFRTGLKTGDRSNPAHWAYLGDQEELYGYADNPLAGDQAFWVHLGIGKTLMKSWWGQIQAELFGTWGAVYDSWKRTAEAWEAGLAFSIPGQFLNGKVIVVYDQKGDFTFGFSIGDAVWWNNPLP